MKDYFNSLNNLVTLLSVFVRDIVLASTVLTL